MKNSPTTLTEVRAKLKTLATPKKASSSAAFFKTGPGEYAEGDQFLGVTVPELRQLARSSQALSEDETLLLLRSPVHEERLLALFLLIHQFQTDVGETQRRVYQHYLAHTAHINNWDLVDTSAAQIVGAYLAQQPSALIQKTLQTLARSEVLWERRIAMVATFHWTKRGDPTYALLVAKQLLPDRHDLIQKAVGWMLREVGKQCSPTILRAFLDEHIHAMGRTSVRYAIEHFPEPLRQTYLKK